MSLNLINDAWIPVIGQDSARQEITPWQMADAELLRPDWPRADLNIACLELLIGLVFMADPPSDLDDWHDRRTPDPERLREKLKPFAPAFNLMGDGPRFLQDLEAIESAVNAPDMLFLDSAGGQTVRNNADLMVWRGRYPALDPAMAAMALYTMQAFAPPGGAGNRTSMRGGGPMVTLVQPPGGLWDLVWANVPYGKPAAIESLPWMRKTATSEKGRQVFPEQSHPVEAFFGMPRRLRLVSEDGLIIGVMQRPYGTNYAGWDHHLTPYYRPKLTDDWLPKHPRAGLFGYRNWLGVVVADEEDSGTQRRARTIQDWRDRNDGPGAGILVAGWSMDNMKPRDFVLSTAPLVQLEGDALDCLRGMIEAADLLSTALRAALKPVLAEGESREAVREAFFAETQTGFEAGLTALSTGEDIETVAKDWIKTMRDVALRLFEDRALPGLSERAIAEQQEIVSARRSLGASFAGHGKLGVSAYGKLMLDPPTPKKKAAA